MKYIADLQVHSRYSRATSRTIGVETLAEWSKIKGIDVIGTGDFTHPKYFKELKENLTPFDNGLYRFGNHKVAFIPTGEISCIYSKPNVRKGLLAPSKVRRIHILVLAPSLEVVEKINIQLGARGNLASDGRPILGIDAKELLKIILNISQDCLVIPAHIWTPWFSLFGSKSGFDSIQECFEELTPHIAAVETGLSSDPLMNWRLSQLDNVSIVSNSDAHSERNLGREATAFEFQELSYNNIAEAIKTSIIKSNRPNRIEYTIEFFPEEGKYHWDGHRACDVRLSPEETKKHKGVCPKCRLPLTIGVMNRVDELADRTEELARKIGAAQRPGYKSLVGLEKIIADVFGQKTGTKKVREEYDSMIKKAASEFNILLNLSFGELQSITLPRVAEGIMRVREGKLEILPGYDGVFGEVRIFSREEIMPQQKQISLGF